MQSILNKYRQFGPLYLVKSLVKKLFKPFFKKSTFYVMAVENHVSDKIPDKVKIYDNSNIGVLIDLGFNLSDDLERQISNFIHNSDLFLYIDGQEVFGWGFLQKHGLSAYAGYNYELPHDIRLFKNLFVNPKHRGKSIGKIINHARLNSINSKCIPLGFVLPSNKYAIRNLEMYGFKIQLVVKDYLWFKSIHKRKITMIKKGQIAQRIKSGFNAE